MIDWKALHRLCEHKAHCEKLSFRDVAYLLGLSPSAFTRMKAGMSLSAESFVTVLNWLKISHRSLEKK